MVGIAVSRVSQIHAAAMLKLRVSLAHLREAQRPQALCSGKLLKVPILQQPRDPAMTTASGSEETMTTKSGVAAQGAYYSLLQLSLCGAIVE